MPKIYYLVGLPGSGKSTWLQNNIKNAVVISYDDEVEKIAKETNSTYNEVWGNVEQKSLKEVLLSKLEFAISNDKDIVVDMTNLTKKARRRWSTPSNYQRVAVVFDTSELEINWRLSKRYKATGKFIAKEIVDDMRKIYQEVSDEEEFNRIITVRSGYYE